MAIIYSYPPNSNILPTDILVCTSTVLVGGKPKNQTKSISIANLSTYVITNPSNNLNQVLINGNTSLLDAKIGELYLYDTANLNYSKLSFEDGELNMYDYTGARIFTVSGSQSYLNFLNINGIRANFDSSILTINRNYTLPNQSGTIALTSDIPSFGVYVPYIGATGDINIGTNSIYTSGGAKLWDDGTVEGTAFQFAGTFSSYINTNATVFRNWTLPDASGTIALTSNIPILTGYVPYTGATGSVNLGTFSLTANSITTAIDSTISGLTIGKGGGAIASNTVLGSDAMLANIIGFDNTAVGKSALQNNLGDDNVAVGHQALFSNTTGDGNTAIGASALFNNIGGINNIGLGFNARALNAGDVNSIVIGYNAVGVGSQSVVIGNTNILTTVLRGKVGIGTTVPLSTIDTIGSISIKSGLTNTLPRPIVSPGILTSGEIRSYSNTSPTADDGFLRLSAGGGSFAVGKAYIDISGYSTIPDMHSNIVFGTTGTEQMRITKEGDVLIGTKITIDSSKFTIESVTQGFLPPRMTNAQRIAIGTPAVGLCVYCTDATEGLYINKSTGWTFIG